METNRYSVRLSQAVWAESPQDAVKRWMDETTKLGMRNVYYRVENDDTGETWMVCLAEAHPMVMPMGEFVELFREELLGADDEEPREEEPSLEELLATPLPDFTSEQQDDTEQQAQAAVAKRMATRKAQQANRKANQNGHA